MTSYVPASHLVAQTAPPGPKLAYEIGDLCWIFVGERDARGNPKLIASKVVFWFDLVDLAQRFYVIRAVEVDHLHFHVRDATVMASEAGGTFPYQRTRHDDKVSDGPKKIDWRNA